MVYIDNFDPLKMQFEIINALLENDLITVDEAKKILKNSLNPQLKEEERDKIVESLFVKK
ncbi:hypothetical protein HYU07_00115 [Candidatus Woesearchaeota archaeon]|nr:hypothetical protein [Candidatus Woesearchaeota archaeon]